MDEVHIEKNLYRILQGRLRFKRDGLVLFIHEPSSSLIYDSYEIYDEAYKQAYKNGVYIKQETVEILLKNDLWTPLDDREAEKTQKEIESKKLEAYQNYFNQKDLIRIKRQISSLEKKYILYKSKKDQLKHVSCEGLASITRWNWLIYNMTFFPDGKRYDWEQMSVPDIMGYYSSNSVSQETYRAIARKEPWRSMWTVGKTTSLFDVPSSQLTSLQGQLCAFSRMYDNVFEHPEQPPEKVVEDDTCLDGWFIHQKRKSEKMKKEQEVQGLMSNPKIANAGEVFLMAKDDEDVDTIYGMNDPRARGIIKQRENQIKEQGRVKHVELEDVQFDLHTQRNKQFKESRRK